MTSIVNCTGGGGTLQGESYSPYPTLVTLATDARMLTIDHLFSGFPNGYLSLVTFKIPWYQEGQSRKQWLNSNCLDSHRFDELFLSTKKQGVHGSTAVHRKEDSDVECMPPHGKEKLHLGMEPLNIYKLNVNQFSFRTAHFPVLLHFPYQISVSEPPRTRQPYLSLFTQSHDNSRAKMLQSTWVH